MKILGIIFSDIHYWNVAELTSSRTVAAIPFAGRYLFIDFMLSNMINSGVHNVGVITKSNYQSLMEYIGSGKDWDLARKDGGINILPPNIEGSRSGLFNGRMDALMGTINYIGASSADYVVMCDCDYITNMDLRDVVDYHEQSGADITCVYKDYYVDPELARHSMIYKFDSSSRMVDIMINPENFSGRCSLGANIWVLRRGTLLGLIANCMARGQQHFSSDVLAAQKDTLVIRGYEYTGYFAHIHNFSSYVKYNMEMLDEKSRQSLFLQQELPIYTKVRDSAPTYYGADAQVSGSMVADGCSIEGHVENSIIFRSVRIGRGAVVKNSIIMNGCSIEDGAQAEWVVADSNVVFRGGRKLIAENSYPMYVARNKVI